MRLFFRPLSQLVNFTMFKANIVWELIRLINKNLCFVIDLLFGIY